jgi:hypothetical protein
MMFIFVVVAEARRLEIFFVSCEYLIFLFARASDDDDAGKTPREHAEENTSRVLGVMRSLFWPPFKIETMLLQSFYKCTRTVLKYVFFYGLYLIHTRKMKEAM